MSKASPPEKPAAPTLDDPVAKARTVRVLLIAAPFMFVGCYLIAWIQGAEPQYAAIIGVAGAAMCAVTALTIQLLGSKSRYALTLLIAVLALAKMIR